MEKFVELSVAERNFIYYNVSLSATECSTNPPCFLNVNVAVSLLYKFIIWGVHACMQSCYMYSA